MQKNKRFYAVFAGILLSICTNMIIVRAENIIPTEKPVIISEENNLYGHTNQNKEGMESILDNFIENEADDNMIHQETIMTPNEILGNQNITMSDFQKIIVSRLLDVVRLFQSVSKPLCVIFFILSAISVVIGIVFDTGKAKSGFLGMMLSIIAYVGIMYAPGLILFFAEWLSI